MEKDSIFSTKNIIVFVIGIAIGFGGAWSLLQDPVNEAVKDEEKSDTISDIALSGDNALLVRNQKAGVNVNVELVTLENAGWVVIHESDNGVLGNALGAQLFNAGPSKGVVELLRGTEAGNTYFATIRQDDGDRAFDLTKDLLLSDGKGNPVQVRFKAIVSEETETEE
jgi:hypothetical protein